jgi:hypothetical protein
MIILQESRPNPLKIGRGEMGGESILAVLL